MYMIYYTHILVSFKLGNMNSLRMAKTCQNM